MGRLVVALLALTVVVPLFGQDEDLPIGSVDLNKYQLDAVPNSSALLIVCQHSGLAKECFGEIGFKDGRLTFISRDWPIDPKQPVAAVVGALTSLAKSCPTSLTVTPDPLVQEPNFSINTVTIRCGNRRVIVSSARGNAQSSVDEQIGAIFKNSR